MKRALFSLIIAAGLGVTGAVLHSQDPAPVSAAAPAPIAPIPKGTPMQMLQAIRDANAKLLGQQSATLQKLEEMEKNSQALKILGKRS